MITKEEFMKGISFSVLGKKQLFMFDKDVYGGSLTETVERTRTFYPIEEIGEKAVTYTEGTAANPMTGKLIKIKFSECFTNTEQA